jgi:His-Xaa-Ser system radical SAM maturase HxsB
MFDMPEVVAHAAVDRVFESPAKTITVEFQGGEPLLAFPTIRLVTELISARARNEGKSVVFAITSTLHHLDDEIVAFLRNNDFQISTSLDGPADIHDTNRPVQQGSAHERTLAGIEKLRDEVGMERLSALTTLTRRSLASAERIVDQYVSLGFRSIFLRPLSPFGFAKRSERSIGYTSSEFLAFYKRALRYILEINASGVYLEEVFASIMLKGILAPYPTTYVDLRSPSGAGFGALVYNYDGYVYASDEGRMLAETGDQSFRMGRVTAPYADLMRSGAIELVAATGLAESLPGCADCAFVPFCGADPVVASGECGDPVGHRADSEYCRRHMGLLQHLFHLLDDADPQVVRTFTSWVNGGAARLEAA